MACFMIKKTLINKETFLNSLLKGFLPFIDKVFFKGYRVRNFF